MTDIDASVHDPYSPPPASFPAARWRRAGATPDEIVELGRAFSGYPRSRQDVEAAVVASVSDHDLREALDHQRSSGDFIGYVGAAQETDSQPPVETKPEKSEEAEEAEETDEDVAAAQAAVMTSSPGPREDMSMADAAARFAALGDPPKPEK